MADDPVLWFFETYSMVMILLSFGVFAWIALRAKAVGNFRFQLSFFMLVWAVSEVPHVMETLGLVDVSSYQMLGLTLHLVSMVVFSTFVMIRSYQFLRVRPPTFPTASKLGLSSLGKGEGGVEPSKLR